MVVSDGADGTACTVADNGDGTKTISCEDGTSVVVSDGADGTACTVADNGDGTKTISCEDGTSVVVSDGADGTACTVADNGDGTKTISCEDGTSVTIRDGQDSYDRTRVLHYDSDIAPIISSRCSSCHVADYHGLANRHGVCFRCHDGDGPGSMDTLRASPALSTEEEVLTAVHLGTFSSWIQPGGFMAWDGSDDFDGNPYPGDFAIFQTGLTTQERLVLTRWADSIQSNRQLDYNPNLLATYVAMDFEPDGTGTNSAWSTTPELDVSLTPTVYTSTNLLRLKALYSDEYLYIRAEYSDSTLSMTRGAWLRDDVADTWSKVTDSFPDDMPSEDRIAFIWNINVPHFKATNGCASKCHSNRPGYASFTDIPGTRMDIWHAKVNRSLPVNSAVINAPLSIEPDLEASAGSATFLGYVDDKELEWFQGPRFDTEDAGRHGDPGMSTYSHNRNLAGSAPVYMETNPLDFLDAMVLTQSEIDAGETIVADPDDPRFAGNDAVDSAWAVYASFPAAVPERILRVPTASRADVSHGATWTDGVWVHEFKRRLDTGDYVNDVIFNDLYKAYEFSVAVFDNCGRGELPPGHTTYGDGQYLVLRFR